MKTYLSDFLFPEVVRMMYIKKKEVEQYKRGIALLQNNPDSIACLKFARIAAWNFSLVESPEMAVAAWNNYLPKELRVNHDAFVDKGETPEAMSRKEMEEIQKIEGVTDDPMKEGFDPFYFWHIPQPARSEVEIARHQKLARAKEEWFEKYAKQPRKMKAQRYWGD